MSETTYSVIFRGDLQPGYTVADVKANFARLFRAAPETVEKLFNGRPLAIKKSLTRAQAEQLQETLAKLGAQSALKPEGETAPAPNPVPAPVAEEVPRSPSPVTSPQTTDAGSGLSLAPMEGYLVKEHERRSVDPVQVPVSHLSLQPEGGNLVQESERVKVPPVQVQVPDWKLNTVATFKLGD